MAGWCRIIYQPLTAIADVVRRLDLAVETKYVVENETEDSLPQPAKSRGYILVVRWYQYQSGFRRPLSLKIDTGERASGHSRREKSFILLVPGAGVEPARPEGQGILSPPRMPFRHPGTGV